RMEGLATCEIQQKPGSPAKPFLSLDCTSTRHLHVVFESEQLFPCSDSCDLDDCGGKPRKLHWNSKHRPSPLLAAGQLWKQPVRQNRSISRRSEGLLYNPAPAGRDRCSPLLPDNLLQS